MYERETVAMRSILERIQKVHYDANEFLRSWETLDLSPASAGTIRLLNVMSDRVNHHLGGCYAGLANGTLSNLEMTLWLPFLETIRRDLRGIGLVIEKSKSRGIAVARLRATLELFQGNGAK
jgi:hypothetical protein